MLPDKQYHYLYNRYLNARKNNNWQEADTIRDYFKDNGYVVEVVKGFCKIRLQHHEDMDTPYVIQGNYFDIPFPKPKKEEFDDKRPYKQSGSLIKEFTDTKWHKMIYSGYPGSEDDYNYYKDLTGLSRKEKKRFFKQLSKK